MWEKSQKQQQTNQKLFEALKIKHKVKIGSINANKYFELNDNEFSMDHRFKIFITIASPIDYTLLLLLPHQKSEKKYAE